MKRFGILFLTLSCLLFLPGCYDQMYLEDSSLTLMLGLDLDQKNQLVIYMQAPVFYKEAKEKSEEVVVKATTIRQSRERFDAIVTGQTIGGKIQTILLGKRLVEQQKDWLQLFDIFYRDPKQSATSIITLVDGPVGEIFSFNPKDKPRLAIHMKKLISTGAQRDITAVATLQQFRREVEEKGMTPSITEIKKDKQEIKIMGTSLLTNKGCYRATIPLEESTLLLILQDHTHNQTSLALPIGGTTNNVGTDERVVTMNVKKVKRKVETNYAQNKFHFEVNVKLNVGITSRNFEGKIKNQKSELEAQIAKELQKEFVALVAKCQAKQVDPFGFGHFARAYQYQAWKPVQGQWGKAFAKADVQIHTQVEIKSIGVME